ncbi:prephenate dehydrogenase [Pseudoxanthomonas indica]|uniref:Prephenate dehydrogenase n=1 Tax=Pseudoxanthomonas indica TaxID=428993 RepID=A0A1T5M1B8_9GAMM|nr:prephenate dehydrogenase [Pseudoxanthomonas indica]GGD59924.1 prephenate dehydrogenase [Pseudoxanthomonas indica]SKC81649.1 prephenate dehydrogenase [Pseudoxanthomonas indica]
MSHPVIGIIGSAGAYGRWLTRFFQQRMGLTVVGQDPADPASLSPQALLQAADVLVFSAPIRHTVAIIEQYVTLAGGREARQLWLDVTSIKAGPLAAMARSGAEFAGLHPMTAPPKAPTLKGRATVICELRLQHWRGWFEQLLQALEGEYVRASPEQHDRVMALVQAMVHASHLAQAGVLREQAAQVGDLASLMPFRSASFEMDAAILSRILSLNPAIYEDIQFGNPHAGDILAALGVQLARMAQLVGQGDEAARAAFRQEFLLDNRQAIGATALVAGNYHYERIGYLLADLAGVRAISVHLPEDRPGSLRELLQIFEREGISLSSIHSSRTPEGEVHFRIGFETALDPERLQQAARAIDASGLGRILEIPA